MSDAPKSEITRILGRLQKDDVGHRAAALRGRLGAAYTLQANRHVRVDVVYARYSQRTRAWIDLLGSALFLIPFCGLAGAALLVAILALTALLLI